MKGKMIFSGLILILTAGVLYKVFFSGPREPALFDFRTSNNICHVKGTIRDFLVTCDKNIDNIQYRFMKSRYVTYFGPAEGGGQENLELLVVNLRKVKGSDKSKDQLTFTLLHNDQTQTSITVNYAATNNPSLAKNQ